jgi:hypothetical protein
MLTSTETLTSARAVAPWLKIGGREPRNETAHPLLLMSEGSITSYRRASAISAVEAARLALLLLFSCGDRVIAADRPIMAASRFIGLMQARTRLAAKYVAWVAVEVLKVEDDAAHFVRVAGERMQCLWCAAHAINRTANLGGAGRQCAAGCNDLLCGMRRLLRMIDRPVTR